MRLDEVAPLILFAAILTVIVVWLRNPPGWLDVLQLITMAAVTVLLALVMGAVWPR